MIFQIFTAFNVINKSTKDINIGFLISLTFVLCSLSLMTAICWGSETLLVRQMTNPNKDLDAATVFEAVTAFSTLLFLLYAIETFLLFRYRGDLSGGTYQAFISEPTSDKILVGGPTSQETE